MVMLNDSLLVLFPGAKVFRDFIVGDNAIQFWNPALGTQPTSEQLAAVTQEQVERAKLVPGVDTSTVAGAKQLITARRYQVEVAGISIEGQQISSERDEIGHWYPRFANAYGYINNDPFALAANPTGEYPYKPKSGAPVIFTATQVIRAYQCLSWYINTCFGVEKYLFDLLDADTPVANVLAAMDAAWPQREFTWVPPS